MPMDSKPSPPRQDSLPQTPQKITMVELVATVSGLPRAVGFLEGWSCSMVHKKPTPRAVSRWSPALSVATAWKAKLRFSSSC
jgi:hypothetical protein